jgi:hypothetical protein
MLRRFFRTEASSFFTEPLGIDLELVKSLSKCFLLLVLSLLKFDFSIVCLFVTERESCDIDIIKLNDELRR